VKKRVLGSYKSSKKRSKKGYWVHTNRAKNSQKKDIGFIQIEQKIVKKRILGSYKSIQKNTQKDLLGGDNLGKKIPTQN
jgi:hypothetical protein